MHDVRLISFAKDKVYEMVVYIFERAFDLMNSRPQSIKYRFCQYPAHEATNHESSKLESDVCLMFQDPEGRATVATYLCRH